MKKEIMKRAWEIARQGAEKFGGKEIEYIAEALKIAWEVTELREGLKAIEEMYL